MLLSRPFRAKLFSIKTLKAPTVIKTGFVYQNSTSRFWIFLESIVE